MCQKRGLEHFPLNKQKFLYPDVLRERLLQYFDFVNADFLSLTGASCVNGINFNMKFLGMSCLPLIGMLLGFYIYLKILNLESFELCCLDKYLYLNYRGDPRAVYRLNMEINGAPYHGRN